MIDGDTVEAQLGDGSQVTVQLLGIDTPEAGRSGAPVECGGPQAADALRQLLEGQQVTLTPDPTQDAVDELGRSWFYVDRIDGLDAGEGMLLRGWARVQYVDDLDFARVRRYERAENEAVRGGAGVWGRCAGDFHRTRADELRAVRRSAATFVREYYRTVSRRRFATAWDMLSRRVRRQHGPFQRWKAGHRRSRGASVRSAQVRLSRGRAVVRISLRSRDRDACSGRRVYQYFRGTWVLVPRRAEWVAVRVKMRRTGGGRVRLSKAECRPKRPPPPQQDAPSPPTDCQGYSPCLPPGPDVDCSGGSGNGPRYVDGPVSVAGSDPYGLDSDGDGVACES